MKSIREMDKAEILALTNEQIETLIDYQCALEGVPLLPNAPVAPVKPPHAHDVTVYVVGDIDFAKLESAQAVADYINSPEMEAVDSRYIPGPGYDRFVVPRTEPVKVMPAKRYSEKHWNQIKEIMTQYEAAKKVYDEALEEYEKNAAQRQEIAADIWETVNAAHEEQRRRESYRAEFERYLPLADGNRTIAMNFLVSARPAVQTDFSDLVQELCPGYPEAVNE